MQYIYAYYFKDGSAYVGRTKCPELRHKQHVGMVGDNDEFRQKVKENADKVPDITILIKTDDESIDFGVEELFIEAHRLKGYKLLNQRSGTCSDDYYHLKTEEFNHLLVIALLHIDKICRLFYKDVPFFSIKGYEIHLTDKEFVRLNWMDEQQQRIRINETITSR